MGSAASSSPWFKVGVGAAIAGQAMVLGFAVNLAHPEGATRWLLHGALVLSAVGGFTALRPPPLRPAGEGAPHRRAKHGSLFLAGIPRAVRAARKFTLCRFRAGF